MGKKGELTGKPNIRRADFFAVGEEFGAVFRPATDCKERAFKSSWFATESTLIYTPAIPNCGGGGDGRRERETDCEG